MNCTFTYIAMIILPIHNTVATTINNDACDYDDIVEPPLSSSTDFNYSEVGIPNDYCSVPALSPSDFSYEIPVANQAKVCNVQ